MIADPGVSRPLQATGSFRDGFVSWGEASSGRVTAVAEPVRRSARRNSPQEAGGWRRFPCCGGLHTQVPPGWESRLLLALACFEHVGRPHTAWCQRQRHRRYPLPPQQQDQHQIVQRRVIRRAVPRPDAAAVFAQRQILRQMVPVLDGPAFRGRMFFRPTPGSRPTQSPQKPSHRVP